jgi:hypothetical protein
MIGRKFQTQRPRRRKTFAQEMKERYGRTPAEQKKARKKRKAARAARRINRK